MTALVTRHLPLVASAPDGIKKLRQLILDLAVKGKLVKQESSDSPASDLLKEIAIERSRLLSLGIVRNHRPSPKVDSPRKPFELPIGWEWAQLGEICQTQTGSTPSKTQPELFGSDLPFIKPGDIYPDRIDFSGEGLSKLGVSQGGRVARAGSLLMVCIGTIGKCNIANTDCSFNQQINAATLYAGVPAYLLIAARSSYFQSIAWAESSSTTIAILNKGKWEAIPIPMPGIGEQNRIVAKVDELMALCDRLEADQADAATAHAQLVQALLDSLTQSTNAADFRASWQRLSEHFHTLFTTEASIDALKKTVRQLAVEGQLVSKGGSRVVDHSNFDHWESRKLADLGFWAVGSGFPVAEQGRSDLPIFFCKVSDMNLPGNEEYIHRTIHTIDEVTARRLRVNIHPAGTVVFPKIGGAIATNKRRILAAPSAIDNNCLGISPKASVSTDYLYLLLTSIDFAQYQAGTSVPALSQGVIGQIDVLLPPLGEQQRVVAKVAELMALCDQLKAGLAESRQLHGRLATALVEQAVA